MKIGKFQPSVAYKSVAYKKKRVFNIPTQQNDVVCIFQIICVLKKLRLKIKKPIAV